MATNDASPNLIERSGDQPVSASGTLLLSMNGISKVLARQSKRSATQ